MMIRLTKELKLEVDTLKFEKLGAYFCSAIMMYSLLLAFGNFGPQKIVNEGITRKYTNQGLAYGKSDILSNENSTAFWKEGVTKDSLSLICKDFGGVDKNYEISLGAEVDYPIGTQNANGRKVKYTLTELRSSSRQMECENLLKATTLETFPLVDAGNSAEKVIAEAKITQNNFTGETLQYCSTVDGTLRCKLTILEHQAFETSSLAFRFLIRFHSEENSTMTIKRANFFIYYENPRFFKYIMLFRVFFIGCTIAILGFTINRLRNFEKDKLTDLHSWILIILLSQVFFNDPFSVMFQFYKLKPLLYLSEFFKIFHLTVLLYFWMSVFDRILIDRIRLSFNHIAMRFKQILLAAIFCSVLFLRARILYDEIKGDIFSDVDEMKMFRIVRGLIIVLLGLFAIYFIGLAGLYFKLYCQGMLPSSRSSTVLYALTTIVFTITLVFMAREYIESKQESVFEYFGSTGAVNIYIFLVALLFVPALDSESGEKDIEMEESKEHEEIMKDVYDDVYDDDEEPEEEEKEEEGPDAAELDESIVKEVETPQKVKPKEVQKKKAWESIQKSLETEDEEKKSNHSHDDDEYLYI